MTDPQFGSPRDSNQDPNQGSNPGDGTPPPSSYPPPQDAGYPPPQDVGYAPPPSDYGYAPPPNNAFPPPTDFGQGQYPPPPTGYGQYPPPPPGYGQYPPPPQGAYYDAGAPYGRHPLTGEPLSDKSKTVAGLLQLIGLFGLLGIGRMYLGQVGFGVAQLLIGLVIGIVTCGIGFIVPVVWGIVDAVLIFTDKVRDPQGRPLRDGT